MPTLKLTLNLLDLCYVICGEHNSTGKYHRRLTSCDIQRERLNCSTFIIGTNFKLHLVLRPENGRTIGVHQTDGHGVPAWRNPVQNAFGVGD